MAKAPKEYLPIPMQGRAVFFDTETTGLYEPDPITKKMPPADVEGGPRMASAAWVIYDLGLRREIASYERFIKPDGWSMPREASMVNGLDDEMLMQIGEPILNVLPIHHIMLDFEPPVLWAGFNQWFDFKILRGEMRRAGMDDRYHDVRQTLDTMWICGKHLTGKGGMRRLSALYQEVFGEPLVGAHGALKDARACIRLFERAIDNGLELGVSVPKNDKQEAA